VAQTHTHTKSKGLSKEQEKQATYNMSRLSVCGNVRAHDKLRRRDNKK